MNEKAKSNHRGRRGVDLRAAVRSADIKRQQSVEITFGELCRAYLAAQYEGADMQLRKWIEMFGERSAWSITSAELGDCLQALI